MFRHKHDGIIYFDGQMNSLIADMDAALKEIPKTKHVNAYSLLKSVQTKISRSVRAERDSDSDLAFYRAINNMLCNCIKLEDEVAVPPTAHIVWKRRLRGGMRKAKCVNNCFGSSMCNHICQYDDRTNNLEPYCSACGKELGEHLNFCGFCGARMEDDKNDD